MKTGTKPTRCLPGAGESVAASGSDPGPALLENALKMPTTTNRGHAYIRRSQTIHGRPSAGALKRQRRRCVTNRNAWGVPQGPPSSALPESPARGGLVPPEPAAPARIAGCSPALRAFRTARSARKRLRPPSRWTRRWLPKDRRLIANSYSTTPTPDPGTDIMEKACEGIVSASAMDKTGTDEGLQNLTTRAPRIGQATTAIRSQTWRSLDLWVDRE